MPALSNSLTFPPQNSYPHINHLSWSSIDRKGTTHLNPNQYQNEPQNIHFLK